VILSFLSAQTFTPNITIEGQNLNAQEERIIGELKNTIERYIYSNSFSNENMILSFLTAYHERDPDIPSGSKIVFSVNAFSPMNTTSVILTIPGL
jgi:hypothetical protein